MGRKRKVYCRRSIWYRRLRIAKLFAEEDLDYEVQTVLRREIAPTGKSRAFINDTPVTLDVMRKIGSRLMDIHSQHETLELGSKQFQLALIDSFAGNANLLKIIQPPGKHTKKP